MFPVRTSVPAREIPAVVIALIAVNTAVFAIQTGLVEDAQRALIHDLALVPENFGEPGRTLWPLFTSQFLHGGPLHLAVNMWTLWLFGRHVEEDFGPFRFLAFYLLCGVAANLAHIGFNLHSDVPVLGASGAIAGVLGGFTLRHPKARITLVTPILFFPILYAVPAAIYTGLWFAFQIVPGLVELADATPKPGIAWWAHIGGLAAGLGLAWLHARHQMETGRKTAADTGKRPKIIAIGEIRDNEPISGLQRPNVIRIGAAQTQHLPANRRASPARAGRPRAAPPAPADRSEPVGKPSSRIPITHARHAKRREAPSTAEPAAPAANIWQTAGNAGKS